jgi:hypothetical protein
MSNRTAGRKWLTAFYVLIVGALAILSGLFLASAVMHTAPTELFHSDSDFIPAPAITITVQMLLVIYFGSQCLFALKYSPRGIDWLVLALLLFLCFQSLSHKFIDWRNVAFYISVGVVCAICLALRVFGLVRNRERNMAGG